MRGELEGNPDWHVICAEQRCFPAAWMIAADKTNHCAECFLKHKLSHVAMLGCRVRCMQANVQSRSCNGESTEEPGRALSGRNSIIWLMDEMRQTGSCKLQTTVFFSEAVGPSQDSDF